MFRFIKNIFKRQEPLYVKPKDLDNFIKTKLASFSFSQKQEGLSKNLDQIETEIDELCQTLKDAELQNKNIPQRAIHIMQGNRDAFITKTKRFIQDLKSEIDYSDLHNQDFSILIDEYNKSIRKPYMVLQEFFANESSAIASKIAEFLKLVDSYKSDVKNSPYQKYKGISGLLAEKKRILEVEADLKKKIEGLKSKIKEKTSQLTDIEKKGAQLEGSKAFREYQSLLKELDEKKQSAKEFSDSVYEKLASLSRGLRKFSKTSIDSKIVDELLNNPLDTIKKAEPEKINKVLTNMQKSIDKLGLKEQNKKKFSNILDTLTLDWIEDAQKKLKKNEQDIKRFKELIGTNPAKKERDELNRSYGDLKSKIKFLNTQLEELEQKFEKHKTEEIESKISKLLNELNIKLSDNAQDLNN